MRHWGDEDAPKLFMVHGWMDISASFQFIVDAMKRDWHVIAPDLRGFGQSEWAVGGYWFPDYLADLEAMLNHYSPDEPVRLWDTVWVAISPAFIPACGHPGWRN